MVDVVSGAPTFLFERHERWVLLVHGSDPPGDAEWQEYVEALRDLERRKGVGVVVLTDGVGPNALQRKMITEFSMRSAVVTSSRVARGMVTALGWIGVAIKAFAPEQFVDALAALDVPEASYTSMMQKAAAMRLRLAGRDPSPTFPMHRAQLQEIIDRSMDELRSAR